MAIRLVCDGCDKITDDPEDFTVRGYVVTKQRHYCEDCDVEVQQFIDERDELHTELASQWERDSRGLIEEFFAIHPKPFKLPDISRSKYVSEEVEVEEDQQDGDEEV